MPVALSAFLDLMLVSIFFPMAIYAVTIGYPTQNWCPAYNGCLDTVLAVKILVIMGAVLGFLLRYVSHSHHHQSTASMMDLARDVAFRCF